jgi:predicted sulfurtransferase
MQAHIITVLIISLHNGVARGRLYVQLSIVIVQKRSVFAWAAVSYRLYTKPFVTKRKSIVSVDVETDTIANEQTARFLSPIDMNTALC